MFKCGKCDQTGLKPRRIVIERKMVTHFAPPRGPRGGIGSQIVREVVVCDACAPEFAEVPVERNVLESARKPSEATMALAASMQERAS